MKDIIFDLDSTLVDTTCLEGYRREKNWQQVYKKIPQTNLYEGIKEVLEVIGKYKIKAAIVSTAPRPYVEKLISYYLMPIQYIVSYHDANKIKPYPDQMLKALDLMNTQAKDCISFGDRVIDIEASNSAGIESVACFWGTKEQRDLIKSDYSHAIFNPIEILTLIR